jgi:hypothetical protein
MSMKSIGVIGMTMTMTMRMQMRGERELGLYLVPI